MTTFEEVKTDENLKEIVKSAFDAILYVSGAWGYTQALATVIEKTDLPIVQLEHTLASMRAYIEMNMTQEKAQRYGSINLNESSREQIQKNGATYDRVIYEITAMREEAYAAFINEYKEGYGTDGFDMHKHFKKRKEATLTRLVTHWFEVSNII